MDVSVFNNGGGGRSTNVNSNDIVGGTMIPMAFGVDGRRPLVSESIVPRQAALEWLLLLCIHWIVSPSKGTRRRYMHQANMHKYVDNKGKANVAIYSLHIVLFLKPSLFVQPYFFRFTIRCLVMALSVRSEAATITGIQTKIHFIVDFFQALKLSSAMGLI
uniref:Uncharacterized protein n=1 Tax=Oryza barthii TaxID=65489 RepID=A0A0D3H2E3_9ORYZ